MARIRTIKPEFFTSQNICNLSPLARLLYIGLWCEADRAGILEWSSGNIKNRYLPQDRCDIEKLASELQQEGLIIIYTVDGQDYCKIPKFSKHQVINNRERESTFPDCTDATLTRESGVKAEGRKEGKEGKGKETHVQASRKEELPIETIMAHGVPEQVAKDYIAHRRACKAALSATAWNGIVREAQKAGMTLEDVLTLSMVRGWRGFEAKFVTGNQQAMPFDQPKTTPTDYAKMLGAGND